MPYANASTPTNIPQPNPTNQLPTYHFASALNKTQTQNRHFLPSTLHYTTTNYLPPTHHSMHSATAQTSNALFNTQLRLILHLCAHPVSQYTLTATPQPSMNRHTVSSLHQRAPAPPHRFLKRTTKCLLNHKMTHCSTYTNPDLPPTLPATLALCKRIHSNKYPTAKSY